MHTRCLVCTLTLLLGATPSLFATSYQTVGLVANNSTVAAQYGAPFTDPNLINPWGMSFSAASPFWVSNQGTDTSTLYSGAGVKAALTVTVPPSSPPPAGPTGQVFNSAGAGNFVVNGTPASFIFDTLSGTISAWNNVPTGNTVSTTVATTAGAVYTGLTLGSVTTGTTTANYLYAANFTSTGGIRVFDNAFTDVTTTAFTGKFLDPNTPTGYAPYNVQLIGNDLYVEYAEVGTMGAMRGSGLGFVDVYDTSGNLVRRLISPGGALNAPWGVALAPGDFGDFSNDLLVGNFGDGLIHAYNPTTGALVGTLANGGIDVVIPGLWGLDFRTNGGSNSVPNGLYFTAGINGPTNESAGLFGYVAAVPEPSAYGLAGLGIAALLGFAVSRGKVRARP